MSELSVSIEQYRGSSVEIGYGLGSHERMKVVQERCEDFVQPINLEETQQVYQLIVQIIFKCLPNHRPLKIPFND